MDEIHFALPFRNHGMARFPCQYQQKWFPFKVVQGSQPRDDQGSLEHRVFIHAMYKNCRRLWRGSLLFHVPTFPPKTYPLL